jgi:hypothetical protein
MKRSAKIPYRNLTPFGWWIYRELEQWTPATQNTKTKRCLVWENTRIIKARNRDQAFAKAQKLGREVSQRRNKSGVWKFLGIADLLPIYERLEDGAEVLWNDLGYMSVEKAKKLVSKKKSIAVFNDEKTEA